MIFPQLILGLHMLNIIPEEVEAIVGLAHNDIMELKEQLSKSIGLYNNIINQLAHYLLAIESNSSSSNNNNNVTTTTVALNAQEIKELYLSVLRYTKSWLCYGMTLSRLYADHRYIMMRMIEMTMMIKVMSMLLLMMMMMIVMTTTTMMMMIVMMIVMMMICY